MKMKMLMLYNSFVFISKVWNVALLKRRVSSLSSQRMLDRVVYPLLLKGQVKLRYNVWIMVMDHAPSRMYPKNQVGPRVVS